LQKANGFDFDIGELDRLPINPNFDQFGVSKPRKVSDHYEYLVKGNDGMGVFEASKRYSDFYMLR